MRRLPSARRAVARHDERSAAASTGSARSLSAETQHGRAMRGVERTRVSDPPLRISAWLHLGRTSERQRKHAHPCGMTCWCEMIELQDEKIVDVCLCEGAL